MRASTQCELRCAAVAAGLALLAAALGAQAVATGHQPVREAEEAEVGRASRSDGGEPVRLNSRQELSAFRCLIESPQPGAPIPRVEAQSDSRLFAVLRSSAGPAALELAVLSFAPKTSPPRRA